MPAELRDLGFLHLGRPESGVRRYGQLIADTARADGGLVIHEAEAGRVDEGAGRLGARRGGAGRRAGRCSCSGTDAAGASTAARCSRLMRFRRAYRGALVVTLHDIFERHGVRERYLAPEAWSLRWLGRSPTASSSTRRSRSSVCAASSRPIVCGSSPTSSSTATCRCVRRRPAPGSAWPTVASSRCWASSTGARAIATPWRPCRTCPRTSSWSTPAARWPGAASSTTWPWPRRQELGLGDRFRITGYLSEEELETWIAATHLAILPFTDLSASGSMSSWIAAGKPMLVSDLPGVREYEPRVPGALHFFSPPEPLPLAAAIRDLLAGPLPDPDPAVQRLAAELSLERTVERYLAVAREALAARRS